MVDIINSCRFHSVKLLNAYFADYSIKPSGKGCNPTVVSGRVRDIWVNRHPSCKILNALDLPLYAGNTEPTEYGSELHAWDVTRGHHHIDHTSSYPTEHMRWALVGHQNALTLIVKVFALILRWPMAEKLGHSFVDVMAIPCRPSTFS